MSSQRHCKEQPLGVKDPEFEDTLASVERELFGCSRIQLMRKLSTRDSLARVWSLIEQRCDDSALTLCEASRGTGASVSALNREVQGACGLTFHQLLRRYRLVNAARLLIETDRPVLEVALTAGFGSVRPLERAFADLLNTSPSRLRRRDTPRR